MLPLSSFAKPPREAAIGTEKSFTREDAIRSLDLKSLPRESVNFDSEADSDDAASTLKETANENFPWRAGNTEKTWLILASLVPLGAAATLLTFTILERTWTGALLDFVLANRPSAQIISAIISAALAGLNLFTATNLLNFAARIHLVREAIDLTTLKLIGAIVERQVVRTLPNSMYVTTIAMVGICALPNFLWVGALTPTVVNSTSTESNILRIPQYSESSSYLWSAGGSARGECTKVSNELGIWSNCTAKVAQSELLRRASLASRDVTGVPHPKFDNAQYSYVGRSYGVGAAPGLVDLNGEQQGGTSSPPRLLHYAYREPGYLAQVNCIHNDTSDWHLELTQPGKRGNGIPAVYYAAGRFPNAPPDSVDFFSVVTLDEDDRNLAVIGARQHEGIHIVAITAGRNYEILNGTQCEITYRRSEFEVNVDVTQKQISVSPVPESESDFDSSEELAKTVTSQMSSLGMLATTVYTSIVGDSLMANIASVTNSSDPEMSQITLGAVEDSLSAMLDTVLVYIGSSQYFVPENGDFSLVDSYVTVEALRLGEPVYAYITFAISLALLVTVCVEALRTRGWQSLPLWNFTDMICLVLSSAAAGDDVLSGLGHDRARRDMLWAGDGAALTGELAGAAAKSSLSDEQVPPSTRVQLKKKVMRLQNFDHHRGGLSERELTTISLQSVGSAGA